MARLRLTAKGVENLTSAKVQTDFWDELTPGLCVRVGASGRKTWFVRYRANGTHRRMKLGGYPALSLAEARKKARRVQAKADAGEDPAQERDDSRSADTTFEAMAREVLNAKSATTRSSTRRERDRILEVELLPLWKRRPAASITRREVVQLVESIAERAPTMANRTLALIKTVYNGALKRGFPSVESNPASLIDPFPEARRLRFLECDEIAQVWRAIEAEAPLWSGAFKLTLLTAQRIGSVLAMRWADIDKADVWTIPAEHFKGGRRHAVPLSSEARRVIDNLPRIDEEFVFPAGRSDATKQHLAGHNAALRRIREASGLPRWTVHDFRTTFRTHATRAERPTNSKDPRGLGVAPHIADAVLGHKEASLGFDRYTGEPERYLLAEKREALEHWGAFVVTCARHSTSGLTASET